MVAVLSLGAVGAVGQSTGGDTVLPPVIDMKPAGPQGGARRITLRDIVELRELQEIRISPEGAWAALIVRQAFLACDCYRTALFVASTQGHGIPQKLAEEGALSGVRWSPDGRYVTYLSQYNGSPQLWRLDPLTRRKQLLLVHDPGPAQGSHEARISPRPPPGRCSAVRMVSRRKTGSVFCPGAGRGQRDISRQRRGYHLRRESDVDDGHPAANMDHATS